jgi:tRNA(Ile)-lysidine synthase
MAPVTLAEEALVLRPLLGLPRSRLAATLHRFGARPVDDPSNADPRFTRSRLRGLDLPLIDPAPFQARRARHAVAEATRLAEAVRLLPEGCARLELPSLGQDAVARRLLTRLVQAIGGTVHSPSSAAVSRLLAVGHGSLGGCVLRADGWLLREAPGPPVTARAGALWDGRFRLATNTPGLVIAAIGVEASAFRSRHRHLPSAALAALPCLRMEGDGTLVAVPHLSYPDALADESFPLSFSPRSGPVTESLQAGAAAFKP